MPRKLLQKILFDQLKNPLYGKPLMRKKFKINNEAKPHLSYKISLIASIFEKKFSHFSQGFLPYEKITVAWVYILLFYVEHFEIIVLPLRKFIRHAPFISLHCARAKNQHDHLTRVAILLHGVLNCNTGGRRYNPVWLYAWFRNRS